MPFTDASLLLWFNFLTPLPVEAFFTSEEHLQLQSLSILPSPRIGKIKFRKKVSFEYRLKLLYTNPYFGWFCKGKALLIIYVISKSNCFLVSFWGFIKIQHIGASLVAQRLRICLPMQGTRVRALVWEDPTCRGATKPVCHNYWALRVWSLCSAARGCDSERPAHRDEE